MMEADTVTLFMRGPGEQSRSYAALDMLDRTVSSSRADDSETELIEERRHTDGQRRLEFSEFVRLRSRLAALRVIDAISHTDQISR